MQFYIYYTRFFTKSLKKINKKLKFSEPFKNLFTLGMVCHETYKDINGNWLYPEEVEKNKNNKFVKKIDKSKVLVGASSLCRSQKKAPLIQN